MVANIAPVSVKLLVTLHTPQDADRVRATGVKVLADYPDTLLVRATPAERQLLQAQKLEAVELEHPPVQVAGASFAFYSALEAEQTAPAPEAPPDRTAYYLVRMVGPAKGEWLERVRALGGTVHADLPGFSLLVGLLPSRLNELRQESWVEGVTPYRATMKVAGALRPGAPRVLDAAHLTAFAGAPAGAQQVEISVFRGESTADIAAKVRTNHGVALGKRTTP